MILDAKTNCLVLVDLQARLAPAIDSIDRVVANCTLLAKAAQELQIPVIATEQNPAGLGATLDSMKPFASATVAKIHFDASREKPFLQAIGERRGVVIAGTEAHVCVLQTALGLARLGHDVAVVADAVGSRHPDDRAAALSRVAANGLEIVTSEMVVFEWLGRSDRAAFKTLLPLVKDRMR